MLEHRNSLHDVGMAVIDTIGNAGFDSLSAALERLDPDFRRLLVEGAYAGLIARPNLALKHRELVTVAVLATIGNADSALDYHAAGMLNTGWTPEEVLETVLHTLLYAGVPTAIAAARIVARMLAERGIAIDARIPTQHEPRNASRFGRLLRDAHEHFDALPPPMQHLFAHTVYGDALNRSTLTLKDRQLATLAIVITQQNQLPAVRQHLRACLRLGWTRSELTEVLIQLTGYIGWPVILPVTRLALDVFDAETNDAALDRAALTAPVEEHPGAFASLPKSLTDLSPLVAAYLDDIGLTKARSDRVEHVDRDKARRLSDIACLTCLARNADAEALAAHIGEALALGASTEEIVDAIQSALPHAGVLAVQRGLAIASTVFDDVDVSMQRETA